MTRKIPWLATVACAVLVGAAFGQKRDLAATEATERMAATVMSAWPAGVVATTKKPGEWGYEEGVVLDGLGAEWRQTANGREFAYIKAAVDKYVQADGSIQMNAAGRAFPVEERQLDNIELGRSVLLVYRVTRQAKYAKAAAFLHEQLEKQPRGPSGGYWHKAVYPNQMWLDGAYMAEPFRAEYAATFRIPTDFDDIAKQFLLMDEHMRDPASGLLRHGWDESKQMAWADRKTGLSPEVWARAVGWYCMALVDVLDWFPRGNPQRAKLVEVLRRRLVAVRAAQQSDHLWWEVMDRPLQGAEMDASKGNFPEASASCMFVYALAKAARQGLLGRNGTLDSLQSAAAGWLAIQKHFVTSAAGRVVLTGTVKAAGLGGNPYRSGSYAYYVGEATGENDAKGVGAYLLAGSEMEQVKVQGLGAGRAARPRMAR